MTRIDIYTTPFCPFCHRAKALLKSKGVEFNDIDVMAFEGHHNRNVVLRGPDGVCFGLYESASDPAPHDFGAPPGTASAICFRQSNHRADNLSPDGQNLAVPSRGKQR